MQLIDIDKARYRKHLNRVIIGCIAVLVVGSLGIAQLLIALFPDSSGSHFHWNLLGVVMTSAFVAYLLYSVRQHPYMTEVVYVWQLKNALNKVNRKLMSIQQAADKGEREAMLALQFSYAGSRLLWHLDDNTIVLEELTLAQAKLDALAKQYNMVLDAKDYQEHMLKQF